MDRERSMTGVVMARKRVLVSVLNHNAVDDTIVTLRCLERQRYADFDLLLLDNASTNDCVERIRSALPHLTILRSDENRGYAGGNNAMLERGLTDGYAHVIVCNNDIEVSEDAVGRLVATAEERPDAGVVGGVEVDYFSGSIRTVGGRFSMWRLRCDWSTEPAPGRTVTEHDFVQGAMVLFTRKALEAGVRMDENMFIYYDEADLGFQLRSRGLRAYVANDVRIHHKADRRLFDVRNGYYQQRNRLYLGKKYGRFYHLWWHALSQLAVELPGKMLLRWAQGHKAYALACAAGFRDGLLGRTGRWNPT